jgi:hypothetical protein
MPDPSPGPLDLSYDELKKFLNLGTADPPAEAIPGAHKIDRQWNIFEARYKYAWDYFDFHAKQRTTMFNFFLIFVGFVISGYVSLLNADKQPLATGLAGLGAILTTFFLFLDRRNEEFVHLAEEVLEQLEADVLFTEYRVQKRWPKRRKWYGPMDKKQAEDRHEAQPLSILLRQHIDDNDHECGPSHYRTGLWLPVFQGIIIAMFLALAIVPWCNNLNSRRSPSDTSIAVGNC